MRSAKDSQVEGDDSQVEGDDSQLGHLVFARTTTGIGAPTWTDLPEIRQEER
jgi:hypothetical protein